MTHTLLQYVFYLTILVVLAIPLGGYIGKVMNGEKVFLTKIISPCEKILYKVMSVNENEEMNWKKYLFSVLLFNGGNHPKYKLGRSADNSTS